MTDTRKILKSLLAHIDKRDDVPMSPEAHLNEALIELSKAHPDIQHDAIIFAKLEMKMLGE